MKKVYVELPEFTGESIPVNIAAKILKKSDQYIRQGMIQGILPIGKALKKQGSSQYDYYISPFLFWQFTGFIYEPALKKAPADQSKER